jgi:UDP-3-O-[3-hydroxymyristoyl] glucosamine N-acyltransferase
VCEDPRAAFAELHNRLSGACFYWQDFASDIHPLAKVDCSAWIAPRNVRIGAHSTIGPRTVVLERCCIADTVTIGASVVLGGAGFQSVRTSHPMIEMEHCGGLTIHSGVRVLPGAVLATGLFRGATEVLPEGRIGSGAFVSHDVQIGGRSFVGHRAVVNGNVIIGEDAWVGPGAVIANNLEIGDHAFVALGAVVIRNVPSWGKVSGNFAVPHQRLLRATLRDANNSAK